MERTESEASDPKWRKSSRSVGNGACVEVAARLSGVAVRDSVIGDTSPVLSCADHTWTAFTRKIKDGLH